jgi:MobA-like NTP transferase domain
MFVFPMMGVSRRFTEAGYAQHKYMLPLHGRSVLHHVVESFQHYRLVDEFIFICRQDAHETRFIRQVLDDLGVAHYRLAELPHPTQGQAQTVSMGLEAVGTHADEEVYIFNIDTMRPGFIKPSASDLGDGYLEVFQGTGSHWSFVLPGAQRQVLLTAEKERISDLCSDGLYYFRRKAWFDQAFKIAQGGQLLNRGEYYIAPLYNHLIEQGLRIKYGEIEAHEVIFCGTPQEYEALNPLISTQPPKVLP